MRFHMSPFHHLSIWNVYLNEAVMMFMDFLYVLAQELVSESKVKVTFQMSCPLNSCWVISVKIKEVD